MNALLVDDEYLTLQALLAGIDWKKCGIDKVYTATSASEARKIFGEAYIHLTFVDVEMPEENGIQLLQWVRNNWPNTIYTVLTGHNDFHYIHAALQLQSTDYLLKPVQYDELLNVIEKMIEKTNRDKELKQIRCYAEQWVDEQKTQIQSGSAIKINPMEMADKIDHFIFEHLADKITIEELATQFYLNPDYLNRIYKKQRGITINQSLINARMNLAAKMLQNGELTATEIAGYLGYFSYPSFVNAFRKVIGMSPTAYQNCQKKTGF